MGDIVDGWQLRRRWFGRRLHNDVVQSCSGKPEKAVASCLFPGNHDEFARAFEGALLWGIQVVNEAVHTTADGRSLWVIHGDYFDGVIQCAKWLAYPVTTFAV